MSKRKTLGRVLEGVGGAISDYYGTGGTRPEWGRDRELETAFEPPNMQDMLKAKQECEDRGGTYDMKSRTCKNPGVKRPKKTLHSLHDVKRGYRRWPKGFESFNE